MVDCIQVTIHHAAMLFCLLFAATPLLESMHVINHDELLATNILESDHPDRAIQHNHDPNKEAYSCVGFQNETHMYVEHGWGDPQYCIDGLKHYYQHHGKGRQVEYVVTGWVNSVETLNEILNLFKDNKISYTLSPGMQDVQKRVTSGSV